MSDVFIDTKQGKIVGRKIEVSKELSLHKCVKFSRIPFARCKRFERAVPYGKWQGLIDGRGTTPFQLQHHLLTEQLEFLEGLNFLQENAKEFFEDVLKDMVDGELFLTVITPEDFTPDSLKPVMVWTHGGGWTMGGADEISCRGLAVHADVVIVCISYRLNILGFLYENFGLWDQLEALKWVKENISSYGGDPDNVTIFGESAGGWSVEALLASNHTKGYFHKAIAQSGSLRTESLEKEQMHSAFIGAVKNNLQVETNEDLKTKLSLMENNEIVELYKKIPQMFGHGITGWANLDDFFPVENFRDIKEFPNKVPFLTGLNSTEGCCLFPINLTRTMMPGIYDGWTESQILEMLEMGAKMTGDDPSKMRNFLDELKEIWGEAVDMNHKMAWSEIFFKFFGDSAFYGCRQRIEEVWEDQPVFHYELDVRTKAFCSEPHSGGSDRVRHHFARADHGDDLIYIFGIPFDPDHKLPHGRFFSEEEKELSKRMMTAWGNFARYGNPGWAQYEGDKKLYKVFDAPQDMVKSLTEPLMEKKLTHWKKQYFKNVSTKF